MTISRKIIRSEPTDRGARAALAALIFYAHELGLITVAKGVTTEAELARATEMGVDLAQGPLFGVPPVARGAQAVWAADR
jgi:EAL domain-containing protein (putative c-di-GMP-specific phosphodiesterase class I)